MGLWQCAAAQQELLDSHLKPHHLLGLVRGGQTQLNFAANDDLLIKFFYTRVTRSHIVYDDIAAASSALWQAFSAARYSLRLSLVWGKGLVPHAD